MSTQDTTLPERKYPYHACGHVQTADIEELKTPFSLSRFSDWDSQVIRARKLVLLAYAQESLYKAKKGLSLVPDRSRSDLVHKNDIVKNIDDSIQYLRAANVVWDDDICPECLELCNEHQNQCLICQRHMCSNCMATSIKKNHDREDWDFKPWDLTRDDNVTEHGKKLGLVYTIANLQNKIRDVMESTVEWTAPNDPELELEEFQNPDEEGEDSDCESDATSGCVSVTSGGSCKKRKLHDELCKKGCDGGKNCTNKRLKHNCPQREQYEE